MRRLSKRMQKVRSGIDRHTQYDLPEAVRILKERHSVNFDETVEVSLNLGVDPRHADQMVRGVAALPHGTGKPVRVAVFARGDQAEAAQQAGAEVVGADELAEEVQQGRMDFDRCIATPDMMTVVGKLGKILGPRGLMPNPKLGTVTPNVQEAVEAAKAGQVQFRVERQGIIHAGVGKLSFDENQIEENVRALVDAVVKAKPSGTKGAYLRKVAVSSTMGPGLRINVANVAA